MGLEKLSVEIVALIFRFLTLEEVLRMRRVCRTYLLPTRCSNILIESITDTISQNMRIELYCLIFSTSLQLKGV